MAASYPEHEKLMALRCPGKPDEPYASHNRLVGDFIEWLWAEGYRICRLQDTHDDGTPRIEPFFYVTGKSTEQLLADFFGIDLQKLDDEKRAMLTALREANAAATEGKS